MIGSGYVGLVWVTTGASFRISLFRRCGRDIAVYGYGSQTRSFCDVCNSQKYR
jgi:hypothetical protein